ncbi:MAG: hypothetical protein AAGM22_12825 [Acidobacteriota bacterium]
MDLFVVITLFVLAASAVAIGIVLTGIAAEVRKTRRAIEKLGEAAAVEEALWPTSGWIGVEGSSRPTLRAAEPPKDVRAVTARLGAGATWDAPTASREHTRPRSAEWPP